MKITSIIAALAISVSAFAEESVPTSAADHQEKAAEHKMKAAEHTTKAGEHLHEAAKHKMHAAKKLKKHVKGADKAEVVTPTK